MHFHNDLQRTFRRFILCALVVAGQQGIFAQSDSAAIAPPSPTQAPITQLKPTIGLGTGMLAFYGDVGGKHAVYSPLVTRVGFDLRGSLPITPWLEGGLYALHGRLGVNERGTTRNLNFESRITAGGLYLRYNFLQVLNPDRIVEPYISVGFGSMEFLSKTDLRDANGATYHYWSDGTIRDIAEDAPNAGQAQEIQRDYVYESDVRETNADGFGKYPERTWSIPLGVGARMDLGGGFDFRIGATMHYTLTDLIDGVTPESRGSRAGTSGNDMVLYSSFSLGWAVPMAPKGKKRRMTPLSEEELDLIVLNDDEDGDGVKDMMDRCPGTPTGVPVDANGCPLDGDGDGVPDHADDELNSAPGALVDMRGVTVDDAAFLKRHLNYLDSGNINTVISRIESFGPVSRPAPAKRVYVVKVGTQVEGISEDLIQRILSIPEVRTIEKGDTTFYVVGNYDSIPEALRRELELRGMGIESVVMAEENGRLIDVSKELAADRARMRGMGAGDDSRDVIVRVQLGAFRKKLSEDIFRSVSDLVVIKGDDGLTRYYTGEFTDVNQAAAHKVQMLLSGFEGAFLVAFREGKRVSMKEAGARLSGPEDLRTLPSGSVSKDKLRYKVQVGTFAGNIPMDTMGKLIEMGDVKPVTSADAVRYFYGSFKDRASAEEAKQTSPAKGFPDAFVVGELDGHIITADDADGLLGKP
jgi:hypothetical protein